MSRYDSFYGKVTNISNFYMKQQNYEGCYKILTLQNNETIVNFIMAPFTFLVDYDSISVGDFAVGFYDGMAPAITIYPQQYQAIVMTKDKPYQNVKVDTFDSNLVSSDGQLKLNVTSDTKIIMQNGQEFTDSITDKTLVVVFGATTRSIPAQTTPYYIVVLCK